MDKATTIATKKVAQGSALQMLAAALKAVKSASADLTFDISNIEYNVSKNGNVEMKVQGSNGNSYTFFEQYSTCSWLELFQETDEPGVLILAPNVRVSDTADEDGHYAIFPAGTKRTRNWSK